MAIESFRQTDSGCAGDDDPDFAGKLSGDAGQDERADTGFAYGAAAAETVSPDAASADSP